MSATQGLYSYCTTLLIRSHAHSHVHRYLLLSLVAHSMASVSSLPGPALQASRSAVQAALAEHPEAEAHTTSKVGDDGSLEPGEIQEVDMQAQAETIRTVFSDSKNFNVKVPLSTFPLPIFVQSAYLSLVHSTRSIPHGHFGSIRPQPRVGIYLRHHLLLFHKHPSRKRLAPHWGGWRI